MARPQKKKNRLVPVLVLILLCLLTLVGWMLFTVWRDSQQIFHDVTVELGQETLGIRDFLTPLGDPARASFVTDPSTIDLNRVGRTSLTLKHGTQKAVVNLIVEDTTPPKVDFLPEYTVSLRDPLPQAGTLVAKTEDYSQVRVYYSSEPTVPEDYSDITVTLVVEDTSGNKTEGQCLLHFAGWLNENCTLELGQTLTPQMLLTNPEKDAALLDADHLLEISGTLGAHTLTVRSGNSSAQCSVNVVDTTAPVLILQNVRRFPGETAEASDFVSSAADLSGEPEISLPEPLPDPYAEGSHTVAVEARDSSGNVTRREATLWISNNLNPPDIQGAGKEMTVQKHSSPDFLSGVTAVDDIDGSCDVTVDTSALDLTKAGTYYITYSATDSSGNIATCKRKVTVEPDKEDTMAAIKELAATLPDDPEAIRDYVHDRIAYAYNSGGDDPIWYGLTTNSGNCIVHANVFKALLDAKGYETQLIWVTNKSHYWVIVKLPEGWRHMDSTPSAQHEKVSIMTDKDRYLNLNGRNWDRSKWPACT